LFDILSFLTSHKQMSIAGTIPLTIEKNNDVSLLNANLSENDGNNKIDNFTTGDCNEHVQKLHFVPSAAEYIKNNYRNTESLSTSLLGQILMGTHIETGRVHCIKMCLKDMQKTLCGRIAENPETEIKTMEAVCTHNHPNLIELFDAIEDSKLFVTIEEYVSNGDMCSYLQKLGHGLPQEQARKYFKQLVEAVSFMHSKGCCHLDISLENILIDETNDCIKLCDFGLSRSFLNENKPFPGSPIRPGKLNYIAPEIVSYQPFHGDKADSFSLGIILFMFLTGFPPFKMASSKDPCFRYFISGRIDIVLREWKLLDIIPVDARDLLSKIFVQSENRLCAKDMVNHPWLQVDGKC